MRCEINPKRACNAMIQDTNCMRANMFYILDTNILKGLATNAEALENERIANVMKDIHQFTSLDGDIFKCFDEALCISTVKHIIDLFVKSKRAKWLFSVKIKSDSECLQHLKELLPKLRTITIRITKKVTKGPSTNKTGVLITKCNTLMPLINTRATRQSTTHSVNNDEVASKKLYLSVGRMLSPDRETRIAEMKQIVKRLDRSDAIHRKNCKVV
jgi:hypothetical protein